MKRFILYLVLMALTACAQKEAVSDAQIEQALPTASSAPALPDASPEPEARRSAMIALPATRTEVASFDRRTMQERYRKLTSNPIKTVADAPLSTFSIDVDTGSYSNVRRILQAGHLPHPDAVRVEEMVNYFPYDYRPPQDGRPFAIHHDLSPAPWNKQNILLRIGIKGQDVDKASLPAANLVFLIDVSGSMDAPDKLPLLKSSLALLVKQLRPSDTLSLVSYAGTTAVVLPPTSGRDQADILRALDDLHAGGGTDGASGIELAYRMARRGYIRGGINRILLATDGDFNVGITDFDELKRLVEENRKSGVSLSTLGFGTGNYNDALMEQLADAGNGAYTYIDNLMEGHKVLVDEMSSTLATIAKDVKIQVEFNPRAVQEYRLVGYENRALRDEDFNNDKVDGGDIGAGHTVTAIYELTLAGRTGLIDPLRYRKTEAHPGDANELATIKLRYKEPDGDVSRRLERSVMRRDIRPLSHTPRDFQFAAAVAGFGQLLRGGTYTGSWSYDDAQRLAAQNRGDDRFAYRSELVELIGLAKSLAREARDASE